MSRIYTEEERLCIIREFKESGLSYKQFQLKTGVKETTVATWIKKNKEGCPGYVLEGETPLPFVRVSNTVKQSPKKAPAVEIGFHGALIKTQGEESLRMVLKSIIMVSG